MSALGLVLGTLSGLAFAAVIAIATWILTGRYLAARCPSCSHGTGLHDRYTGKCGARVNTARWLHRSVGVRSMTACKCVAVRP